MNLTLGIISRCKHISNHHVVHLKYIQFLFVSYTSVKLGLGGRLIDSVAQTLAAMQKAKWNNSWWDKPVWLILQRK